jgi:hypothetical protein
MHCSIKLPSKQTHYVSMMMLILQTMVTKIVIYSEKHLKLGNFISVGEIPSFF